jgi:hypothetical protein
MQPVADDKRPEFDTIAAPFSGADALKRWESDWETVGREMERDRRQRMELIEARTRALAGEQSRLKGTYDRLRRESDAEFVKRRESLQASLGAALTRLAAILDEPFSPFKPQKFGPVMRDIVQNLVPNQIADVSSPSGARASALQQLYNHFDMNYQEWRRALTSPRSQASSVGGGGGGGGDTLPYYERQGGVDLNPANWFRKARSWWRRGKKTKTQPQPNMQPQPQQNMQPQPQQDMQPQPQQDMQPQQLTFVMQKHDHKPPSTKKKSRSPRRASRRSLIDDASDEEKAEVAQTAVEIRREFEEDLASRLGKLATRFLADLRSLTDDMLREARQKSDARLERKRTEVERGTGIPSIQRSIKMLRDEQELRDIYFGEIRGKSRRQLADLQNKLTAAQSALAQQRRLIDATRVVSASDSVIKRSYPTPGSVKFADELARLYPSYRMEPTDLLTQGNQCRKPDNQVPSPPKPYQQMMQQILTTDSPYSGFLAYHGVGSGKTRLSWGIIEQWFLDRIAETRGGDPGAAILVLLPKETIIASWRADSKWVTRFRVSTHSETANTVVLRLDLIQTTTTSSSSLSSSGAKPAYVVLHRMTLVLPDSVISLMRRTTSEPMIENAEYVLKTYDYETYEAYKSLTVGDRRALKAQQSIQEDEVLSRSKLMVPRKTLIVVDEAHNLIDSSEIARNATAANTVLAFVNLIIQAVRPSGIAAESACKLLELTGTPLLDTNRLSGMFKLLNVLQPDASKRWFEGSWRRTLTSDTPPELKEAFLRADEAETRYLETQAFDVAGSGTWRPGQKERLQESYAGLVSYVTLANDPTVYPQVSLNCETNPTCTFQWDDAASSIRDVTADELANVVGLPPPKRGRNLLVPMSKEQWDGMQKAMNDDLSRWSETRRLDASTEQQSPEGLNYGARQNKSSMMVGWGLKTYTKRGRPEWAPKLRAALFLLRKYATDKHFMFTASQNEHIAHRMRDFFSEVGGYEVVDIAAAAKIVRQYGTGVKDIGEVTSAAKLIARRFYNDAANKRRILMFIGSSSALKDLPESMLSRVREVMIELFNDDRNNSGAFFQSFLGDRSTKEGISLFHVMHAHMLDVPTGTTMLSQAEARVLRFCSHSKFPTDRWQVTLWRYIAIPPPPNNAKPVGVPRRRRRAGDVGNVAPPLRDSLTAGGMPASAERLLKGIASLVTETRVGGAAAAMTNEEYQYLYMEGRKPFSDLVLEAIREIAVDCPLFRDYNQNVAAPERCYGDSASLSTKSAAKQAVRRDSFCMARNHILARDEAATSLTEMDETKTIAAQYPIEEFDDLCARVQSQPTHLPPATYRDLLVQEALQQQPLPPTRGETQVLEQSFGLPPDTIFVNEVLRQLARAQPMFAIADDVQLWRLASGILAEHRPALVAWLAHRLARRADDDRAKFRVAVDQLTTLMQRERETAAARLQLNQLLSQTPPSFSDVERQVIAFETVEQQQKRQALSVFGRSAAAAYFRPALTPIAF